jgi:hypothetical protein
VAVGNGTGTGAGGGSRNLILAAMIFAVAMTFIAYATRSVLYVMAAIMAAAAVAGFIGLRAGVQEEGNVKAAETDPEVEAVT